MDPSDTEGGEEPHKKELSDVGEYYHERNGVEGSPRLRKPVGNRTTKGYCARKRKKEGAKGGDEGGVCDE